MGIKKGLPINGKPLKNPKKPNLYEKLIHFKFNYTLKTTLPKLSHNSNS